MSYTYPEKFTRDNVIASFLLLSVVMVTMKVMHFVQEDYNENRKIEKAIANSPILRCNHSFPCFQRPDSD